MEIHVIRLGLQYKLVSVLPAKDCVHFFPQIQIWAIKPTVLSTTTPCWWGSPERDVNQKPACFPGRAQQKSPTIEKNGIPQQLIVCFQPCVQAVSLSAWRCWSVRYAADVLTLMTLLAWVGSKSSYLDVSWPPWALSFLYHSESVKKCHWPCPGMVHLRWTTTFESCFCILKMSQA